MFPVLPRFIACAPDHAAYQATPRALDARGAPVIDHCRGTLPVGRDQLAHGWAKVLTRLPLGLTHLALHCTMVGEFAAMSPLHAPWRDAKHELIASGKFDQLRAAAGIEKVRMCALQKVKRQVCG